MGDKCKVESCGPKHPQAQERKAGDKAKIMRPGHASLSKEQESHAGKAVWGKCTQSSWLYYSTSQSHKIVPLWSVCSPPLFKLNQDLKTNPHRFTLKIMGSHQDPAVSENVQISKKNVSTPCGNQSQNLIFTAKKTSI